MGKIRKKFSNYLFCDNYHHIYLYVSILISIAASIYPIELSLLVLLIRCTEVTKHVTFVGISVFDTLRTNRLNRLSSVFRYDCATRVCLHVGQYLYLWLGAVNSESHFAQVTCLGLGFAFLRRFIGLF